MGNPVYDSVYDAVKYHQANSSILYIPAPAVKEAAFEAIESRIKLVVIIITETVPFHDPMKIVELAKQCGSLVIGPNTPGIVSPEEALVGFSPAYTVDLIQTNGFGFWLLASI